MDLLVGHTGFVGSNLRAKHDFDMSVNSETVETAFGTQPDLCVYCGIRAEKFLANSNPEKDFAMVLNAVENIKKIRPKKLVLISTADVYACPIAVDENTDIDETALQPYGKNRYYVEKWVADNCEDYHIVRLPGLFGKNLKKNFIYDLIHIVPSMLDKERYRVLSETSPLIKAGYALGENGFYRCICDNPGDILLLKKDFERVGFSALNFTDSRAVFQFYNLSYLWEHLCTITANDLRLVNLTVEPLSVGEIFYAVRGTSFVNELPRPVPRYDLRTLYFDLFGGNNGYIFGKQRVLSELCRYIAVQDRYPEN